MIYGIKINKTMMNLIFTESVLQHPLLGKNYVKMQAGNLAVTLQILGSRIGRHERWRQRWRQPQSRNVIK